MSSRVNRMDGLPRKGERAKAEGSRKSRWVSWMDVVLVSTRRFVGIFRLDQQVNINIKIRSFEHEHLSRRTDSSLWVAKIILINARVMGKHKG